ncbi:MAG: VWA domain-containing protein [Roseibacillus sp.]|nr:VWA domain-containing protein [Roseibacillus sp.]
MTILLEHFGFENPWWLLSMCMAAPLFFLRNVPGTDSGVNFSSLGILSSVGKAVRERPGSFTMGLLVLTIFSCCLAMARPQWRNLRADRSASGIDIMIALDVSQSMKTEDYFENKSTGTFRQKKQRIQAAKEMIRRFIQRRQEDRIGLIAFGARPYSVCPLTLDHLWLSERLEELRVGDLDSNGTAIGSAVAASTTRLDSRQSKSKIILLVTDGASNSGSLTPIQAADAAASLKTRIYTVAIGAEKRARNEDDTALIREEYDTETLKEIAATSGGEFFRASDMGSLRQTFSTIDSLEKSEAKTSTVIDSKELYPWLLGAAACFALLSVGSLALTPPILS